MLDVAFSNPLALEHVILVDGDDRPLGQGEKHETHQQGLLHRAFSVFLFDAEQRLLIQRRADIKYHSKGLWANTCCGHPRPEESLLDAAKRRVWEELGIRQNHLVPAGNLSYHLYLDQGMQEHEYTHFFVGATSGTLSPNPDEVQDYAFVHLETLIEDLRTHPTLYARWFRLYLRKKRGEMSVFEHMVRHFRENHGDTAAR